MGTTPNFSWPYPESSDYVADGATAIENLADAIDTTIKNYQNAPKVLVSNSTAGQTMTGGIYNICAFDYERFDTHGMHDNVTNNSRLTIPAGWGGYYLLVASGVTNTGTISIVFHRSGSLRTYAGYCDNQGAGSAILFGNPGDYFEWRGYASTNLTLYGGASLGGNSPQFAAYWIGT